MGYHKVLPRMHFLWAIKRSEPDQWRQCCCYTTSTDPFWLWSWPWSTICTFDI